MTTDPTPEGVAGARADATNHLVPRAVRPIDIEHDQLMARAEAEHQARVTADQARATDDRRAVLREAADAAEDVAIRLHREHHVERSNGAYDVMTVLAALARETAAGERDEQQTQQGCALCGHRTCMLGKPCGVIATEHGDLAERCGCTGGEAQQPDTEAPTVKCSRAVLRQPHTSHGWQPQPGMAFVNCPGASGWEYPEPAAAPVAGQPPADTGEEAGGSRVQHSGPNTKFCVGCLSGEHERIDEEARP